MVGLAGAIAQDGDRLGQLTDFIAAVGGGDFDRKVAGRQTLGHLDQPDDAAADIARQRDHQPDGGDHHHAKNQGETRGDGIKGVIDIVDEDAGHQNPVPGLEIIAIGHLGDRRGFADVGEFIGDDAAADGRHLHQFLDDLHAIGVLVFQQNPAFPLGAGGMHQTEAVLIEDAEIFIAGVTGLAQGVERLLLGGRFVEFARLSPVVKRLHHPFGDLGQICQLVDTVGDHRRTELIERHPGNDGEADNRQNRS